MATHLHLTATFKAQAGSEAKLQAALQECQVETRKEKGCIKYDLVKDNSDSSVFIFIEEWDEQSSLTSHNQTPHIAKLRETISPLLVSPVQLHVCSFIRQSYIAEVDEN